MIDIWNNVNNFKLEYFNNFKYLLTKFNYEK
jgi:hypothetical protein